MFLLVVYELWRFFNYGTLNSYNYHEKIRGFWQSFKKFRCAKQTLNLYTLFFVYIYSTEKITLIYNFSTITKVIQPLYLNWIDNL